MAFWPYFILAPSRDAMEPGEQAVLRGLQNRPELNGQPLGLPSVEEWLESSPEALANSDSEP